MPAIRLQHLYSGRDVNILDLEPSDVDIIDIAHALAHQCRFAGHTKFHYSIAQHSVYVAERVFRMTGGDPERTLLGLLHDASEAYLTDLPRPLKVLPAFEFYRVVETQVQRRILGALGLPLITNDPLVTEVDNHCLALECRQLFDPAFCPAGFADIPDRPNGWYLRIGKWIPSKAEARFLALYAALTDKHHPSLTLGYGT